MEKKELTPEELEELKQRHIRSFVMRRGHISNAQKRALEEALPRYAVEYEPKLLDFNAAFGREAPVVLEIGCGMGETTCAIAATRKSTSSDAKSSPPAWARLRSVSMKWRSPMCASCVTMPLRSCAT